jgi:hypothetical protein
MQGISATLPGESRGELLVGRATVQWLLASGKAAEAAQTGAGLDARIAATAGPQHQWRYRNWYWTTRAQLAARQTDAALATARTYYAACDKTCAENEPQWLNAASTLVRAEAAAGQPLSINPGQYLQAFNRLHDSGQAQLAEWQWSAATLLEQGNPAAAKLNRGEAQGRAETLYGSLSHWAAKLLLI